MFKDFQSDLVIFLLLHEGKMKFEEIGKLLRCYELNYLCKTCQDLLLQSQIFCSLYLLVEKFYSILWEFNMQQPWS